jgi:chromosome segregation ATPase
VFSYSNPYYIVKQGQINSIACCIEVDRLRVVREVVGTELYMEKKGAEEELAATDTIVTQVGDSLRMVADRL